MIITAARRNIKFKIDYFCFGGYNEGHQNGRQGEKGEDGRMILSDSKLMRLADESAINDFGIDSLQLMDTAAGHVAEAAKAVARKREAYVFCGAGNNGGDGVAAAALLLRDGFSVRVLLCGNRQRMSADTREMERRLNGLGGSVEDFDPGEDGLKSKLESAGVIIDAIFGIGLNREVSGPALDAIRLINGSGAPVVSADIPSGVDADTGRIMGAAVRADVTVTFSMAKTGHFAEPGCTCCGRVEVRDIGIPPEVLARCGTDTRAMLDGEISLPRRDPVSHKGDYGRVLIAGGCVGYTGAPSLCAQAAVRSGAGLVYLAVPEAIYGVTAVKNDEAMPFPLPCGTDGMFLREGAAVLLEKLGQCDVLAAGPGMGRGKGAVELVLDVLSGSDTPAVVDADGLYGLSRDISVITRRGGPVVLTPHEGEFIRLGGRLTGDRVSDARAFAGRWGCTVVLKGHRTVVAFPDGEAFISTRGNAGMAKGGSGDVLTGIVAAMMGQFELKRAVTTAVFLHGLAGDLCRDRLGEYAMTAGDLVRALPEAAKILEQE